MTSALVLLPLLVTPLVSEAGGGLETGTLLVFKGNIVRQSDEPDPGKTFGLTLYVADRRGEGAEVYWLVDETGSGAWPWPERFGRLDLNQRWQGSSRGPSLLYDRKDGTSTVRLRLPLLAPPETVRSGAAWKEGELHYQVITKDKIDDRETFQVLVRNKFGRKRQLWLDSGSPLVVRMVERVFMGMGEEYQLELRLTAAEASSPARRKSLSEAFATLVKLREKMKRKPGTESPELSEQDLATAKAGMAALNNSVASGPLVKLIKDARGDLNRQLGTADDVAGLVKKYVGRTVDDFTAEGFGKKVDAQALAGHVTVLHFWSYRDKPLKEPYGQVGYLDFLYSRHKERGVKVYGVAVDNRLGDATTRSAAVRSVSRLKSFMNLGYPVFLDHGPLVRKFGDPRQVGAELPLFVVIGPDRTIKHYHTGFYEVDRDHGLKELDNEVTKAGK